ncbi:hypothetical protein [Bradyrhizobium sp. SZCCHNS3051]|uniref:hypothetical protein n=1 Tax=Bradyrhizobium sp. SZCCHNS3051 TaxID=3057320 RepID=UPI002916DC0D|nr:hypothetical protein [Bradyrhizobium sp. SZCCHNS3051]
MAKSDDQIPVLDIKPLTTPKLVERRTGVVRERLAVSLTALVALCILGQIAAVLVSPANAPLIREEIPMRELLVIYGTVIGFYFGSKQR